MSYYSPDKDFIPKHEWNSELNSRIFVVQIKEFQSEVALFWHNLHHPIKHIKEASSQIREVHAKWIWVLPTFWQVSLETGK